MSLSLERPSYLLPQLHFCYYFWWEEACFLEYSPAPLCLTLKAPLGRPPLFPPSVPTSAWHFPSPTQGPALHFSLLSVCTIHCIMHCRPHSLCSQWEGGDPPWRAGVSVLGPGAPGAPLDWHSVTVNQCQFVVRDEGTWQ